MRLRRCFPLVVLGALFLGGAFILTSSIGCGDSKPPAKTDKGKQKDLSVDIPVLPDLPPPKPDQPRWPDKTPVDQSRPTEAYVGTPYGCQTDADCFGQKCCTTPWGVKLCAPSCT